MLVLHLRWPSELGAKAGFWLLVVFVCVCVCVCTMTIISIYLYNIKPIYVCVYIFYLPIYLCTHRHMCMHSKKHFYFSRGLVDLQ